MKRFAFALVAGLAMTAYAVQCGAGCAVNLKIKNNHTAQSGTIVWIWFKDNGSRIKKADGNFWNSLCGSGDDCSCPSYRSIYPGSEYTCSTRLESSCSADDRDFDLIYDQGSSESNKQVSGAVKTKRDIDVWEGKTVTFSFPGDQ